MKTDYDAKWALIKRSINDAKNQKVEQVDMSNFLKDKFNIALLALQDLVVAGIDLADKRTVAQLQDLILAICQIPQGRVFAFDVSTVLEDFEEDEERFYKLLAFPGQNAETSFTCDWIVGRLDYWAETPEKINIKKLDTYLDICEKLAENGSDKIRAYLVKAIENLSQTLTSEWMPDEAKKVLNIAIRLLSQENPRIIQREGRLNNAQDIMKLLND